LAEQSADDVTDGERKIVTALFADLKGSTELLEALDPEEGRAIVEPLLHIMVDAVQRYEGYVVRTTGDGIFALFGAPIAYEDHPQRALYAALLMQQELRAHGQYQATRGRTPLEARVGVHTGEVVAYAGEASGKAEYRLIGHTANLASRMETIAPAGSIAVSDYTAKLCEGYFELRALRATAVKGVSKPVEAYEVLGPGALRTHFELSARRGLTRFVGRERELEQIERALTRAIEGSGQVVAVVAEAGTGKSRLFYEFKAKIPSTCKVLEAYSVSHDKASAWLPVVELLRKYFGIQDDDEAAGRREKVRTTVIRLDPALEDTLPYLFGLLGIIEGPDPHAQMDARIKRQRTLEAIRRLLLRDSLKQPVVVVFEDLHWIDEQTQALLDLLADSLASARVLLLFNYRPEYRHEWTNKSYYAQIRLDPLGNDDGAVMLSALLGDGEELNPLKGLIAERTGGNPFFMEEIVQALFDEGALIRNGSVKVKRSLAQLRLPPTVQGMLAARIDRLPAAQKEILQTLAVIGRESPLALLNRVATVTELELSEGLAALRAVEFIYEQPSAGDTVYVFKHALTQEVAYNSLLIERRKLLHERAGHKIETLFGDQLDDHISTLAYHYSRSDNAEKAIEYLGRAGQQALVRSAFGEAAVFLRAALTLLRRLPEDSNRDQRELLLQVPLARALQISGGYTAIEAEEAFSRAGELCEHLGDQPELFFVLHGLWAMHLLRGQRQDAYRVATELLLRIESACDQVKFLIAHGALGATLFEFGQFPSVREHLEKAVSFYYAGQEKAGGLDGFDFLISWLSYLATTMNLLGFPDQALAIVEKAIALGEERGRPFILTFAVHFSSFVHGYRRQGDLALKSAERVIDLSRKYGFPFWLAQATCVRGEALAEQGHSAEGIADLSRGLAAMRAIEFDANRPTHLSRLAKAYGTVGRLDEALSTLDEAMALAAESGEHKLDAERFQLKGELLLKRSKSDFAEVGVCFEKSIEIARSQSAKWFELRATASLARLLGSRGRREEGRTRLARIYNWFTEGFDTLDLKEAKALLDELSN
jgi:class 3 adenylate cyclase/predicted ATPase